MICRGICLEHRLSERVEIVDRGQRCERHSHYGRGLVDAASRD